MGSFVDNNNDILANGDKVVLEDEYIDNKEQDDEDFVDLQDCRADVSTCHKRRIRS